MITSTPRPPTRRTDLAGHVAALADEVIARIAVLNAAIGVGDPDIDYREDLAELAGLTWVAARLCPLVARVSRSTEARHE